MTVSLNINKIDIFYQMLCQRKYKTVYIDVIKHSYTKTDTHTDRNTEIHTKTQARGRAETQTHRDTNTHKYKHTNIFQAYHYWDFYEQGYNVTHPRGFLPYRGWAWTQNWYYINSIWGPELETVFESLTFPLYLSPPIPNAVSPNSKAACCSMRRKRAGPLWRCLRNTKV